MRIIKLAFLSCLLLFFLITCISFFIPSKVRISRATNTSAPSDSIFQQVRDLSKWKNWYPGFDTTEIVAVKKRNNEVHEMKANNISVELIKNAAQEVAVKFQLENKAPVISGWKTINYSHTDSVTVQWYMDFKLNWYPWEKFSSLFYERIYGASMEKGLTNLKQIVEAGHSSNN